MTYSGHKGKGYEVQVSETCDSKNPTQIITYVELTPSCESDVVVPLPLLDTLNKRNIQPDELFADTIYGSGRNAIEAEFQGTVLISPVAGPVTDKADKAESDATGKLTAVDFQIDVTDNKAAVCPAGHEAVEEYEGEGSPERVLLHFNREVCQACSIRSCCPVKYSSELGVYVLTADLIQVNIKQRRRLEASGEFRKRYAVRAGIEGTNSELKRAHGLGRLRVRGGCRVNLAVYLKRLACNIKRMVKVLLEDKLRRPCLEQEQVAMMV